MSQIINYPLGKIGPENDRSGRILTAGILLVIFGVFSACLSMTIPLAMIAPRPAGSPTLPMIQLILALVIYIGLTAIFITLGIGAFMKRRWFRPLTLILSTHWLILGSLGLIIYLLMVPMMNEVIESLMQNNTRLLPGNFNIIMMIVSLIFFIVLGIGFPLTMLLLVKSPAVKETLEYYSPKPSWTDHCPINILGMAITLIVAGAFILMAIGNAWVPMLFTILTGPIAILIVLVVSSLLIVSGLMVFKLDIRGWWIGLIVITLFSLLATPTSYFVSPTEYYRLMGQPPEMIEVAAKYESSLRLLMMLFPLAMAISFPVYMWRLKPQLETAANQKKLATV